MSDKFEAETIRHTDAAAEWAASEPRVALFSVAAESGVVEYTMPAKPNPGVALRYLKRAREEGELANAWIIETAIGADGYEALCDELINYEGDPVALLRGIVGKIQTVAMGGLEVPKG